MVRLVSVYFVGRGIAAALSLVSLGVYTRLLEPQEYARYVLVISGVGFVSLLLFQWARAALLRFLPMRVYSPEKTLANLATSIFWLCTAASLVVLGVSLLVPTWRFLLVLGAALLWAQVWFEHQLEFLRVEQRATAYVVLLNLRALLALLIGIGIAEFVAKTAAAPLLGMVIGALLAGLLSGVQQQLRYISRIDPFLLKEMLRYGLPLTFSLLSSYIIATSDRFLIAWFLDEGMAGVYAASYDFAQQSVGSVLSTVNLATYPAVIRTYEQGNRQATIDQVRHTGVLMLATGIPVVALMVLLAQPLSTFVLGTEFRATALQTIPWVSVAALLAGLRAYWIDLPFFLKQSSLDHSRILALGALANLALNVWWIPLFGLMGAIYATLASYALTLVLSIWKGRRLFPIPISWGDNFKIAVATFAMVLAVWQLRSLQGLTGLLLQVLVAGLVYGIIGALLYREQWKILWRWRR